MDVINTAAQFRIIKDMHAVPPERHCGGREHSSFPWCRAARRPRRRGPSKKTKQLGILRMRGLNTSKIGSAAYHTVRRSAVHPSHLGHVDTGGII
ncbi:hypothetical protein FKM82_013816 [Ascaphus truei]